MRSETREVLGLTLLGGALTVVVLVSQAAAHRRSLAAAEQRIATLEQQLRVCAQAANDWEALTHGAMRERDECWAGQAALGVVGGQSSFVGLVGEGGGGAEVCFRFVKPQVFSSP